MRHFSARVRACISVVSWLLVVPGLLLSGNLYAQSPQDIDRLTRRWLDTERQANEIEADWREQQPLLEQRITLLRAEKQQLQDVLKQSSASQDDVAEHRAELLEHQADLEAQQATLQQSLDALLARMQAIEPLLPETLAEAWEAESGALSEGPDTSMKLQVALAQLGKLAEFNGRVSVNETPVETPDGKTVLVKQLYLGVGAAWFVSADGKYAGSGQAGANGWQWQFREDLNAAEIARAIAIFEKQAQADFVQLPLTLEQTEGRAQP